MDRRLPTGEEGSKTRRTMPRGLLATAGIFLAATGIALSAGGAYAYAWDRGHNGVIAPGVRIAGVEVGGLRAAQATAVLQSKLVGPLGRPVRLVSGPHLFLLDPPGKGLQVGLPRMVALAGRENRD